MHNYVILSMTATIVMMRDSNRPKKTLLKEFTTINALAQNVNRILSVPDIPTVLIHFREKYYILQCVDKWADPHFYQCFSWARLGPDNFQCFCWPVGLAEPFFSMFQLS